MQTIGERLEEARKKKGISIREAAEATKIRGDYLSKFESNQFDINLTELYVRGFLRTYASYLKVPADRILNDYAALGRGSENNSRSRPLNREIYGKMDVSIASAEERHDAPAPAAADEPSAPPSQPTRRHTSSSPRVRHGGESSSGPAIDPALVFKFSKWAGVVVAVLLVAWGVKAIVSSSSSDRTAAHSAAPAAGAPVATTPVEPTITLVALDTVRVTVTQKNPDGTDGATLFTGTLVRGQTQPVPKPGPIYILASAAENLQIEVNGKRWPTGQSGYKKMQVQ
jgi:transcriptional regulator with XRE-family HTH domain